jgi:hypothetical protein
MPNVKFVKCKKCGAIFEYAGVGRVPDLCPNCRAASGPQDTGRVIEHNGVTYRVLKYPKTGKEVLQRID